ncbi:unnamed protein product [Effrenium voratum]|uniref:Uncharacterized protein n=1 Tax=Effrenium voratum TaxID=2562239 RepID=A0AA36MT07_9DINO|nr:unnamed protein product [Effrenium voratum]
MGLRLVQFALIVAGPPCSMFIFLSSSQHQRHIWGPCGNPFDRATQLANLIASNTVVFLRIIKQVRVAWVVLEQPRGSWLLKLPAAVALSSELQLGRVSTHMCFWGHQLEKATVLVGDLPNLSALHRRMTKGMRRKMQRAHKTHPPMWVRDARGKVHGAPRLAQSAVYPRRFCNDLALLWKRAFVSHLLQRCLAHVARGR